jgi:hypothetical protein
MVVYGMTRGKGRRPRSGRRRASGQAGEARCGARAAGGPARRPRWRDGGASLAEVQNRVGLRSVSSCPTTRRL